MAKMAGNISIKISSGSEPDSSEWVEIGGVDLVWAGIDLAGDGTGTALPPAREPINLSRVERDMEALVAEYPADETAPVGWDGGWTWITPEAWADSVGLMQTIYSTLSISAADAAKAFESFTADLQKIDKEYWFGNDDIDPDRKPSRAERRHPRKPYAAIGSGPAWRNDNRPGVRDFRRAQRRDMRRGSRY